MEGKDRRDQIMRLLKEQKAPMSGSAIAGQLGVSRQVIVQDIALLRAVDKNILSTTKGYVLFSRDETTANRTFSVMHSPEEIGEELNTIVDAGGRILDVVVDHPIYGPITVDLILGSRKDVAEFVSRVQKSSPLMRLTNGQHYHTVEAASEKILDDIENELCKKGYLLNA